MWEGSIKLYCISSPTSHNGEISWSHTGVEGRSGIGLCISQEGNGTERL